MKPYPPLGILYISAHLKRAGVDVEVFDTTFTKPEDFAAMVREKQPPIVGIYCNMMTRQNVLEMVRISKNYGAMVIVGGPEPANYAREYLSTGVDVVVVGEGELTLTELVPHLDKHGPFKMEQIRGIIYRSADDQIITTAPREQIQDLDEQPFPDRQAIDIKKYVEIWRTYHGKGAVSLITARGCPYKCKWCSHSVFGYTHRRRSPTNVADELAMILQTYQPDMVWYADDVFTINFRWLFAYQDELKRRNLYAPFETISREDRLDEKVVKTLAEMGCYRLWIGSESGSQHVLDAMERRTDAARVRDMTHLLQSHGIQAGMFIMLGYDGEKLEDIEETVDHLKAANPDVFLTTVAYPIKGTPYYQEVAERVIPLKSWEEGSDRDFTVAGRFSRRFYEYANRWMVNQVALHKARRNGQWPSKSLAKHFVNAKIGHLGMKLTQHEREGQK
jgi:radical SAM superfamily enzyme YgiQ (UPF0313 family)